MSRLIRYPKFKLSLGKIFKGLDNYLKHRGLSTPWEVVNQTNTVGIRLAIAVGAVKQTLNTPSFLPEEVCLKPLEAFTTSMKHVRSSKFGQ